MNKSQYKQLGRFTPEGTYFAGLCPCCKTELFFNKDQAKEFMANCYEIPNKLTKLKYAIKRSDSAIPTLVAQRKGI